MIDINEPIDKVLDIKRDLGITSFLVTKLGKKRRKSFYIDFDGDKDLGQYFDVHKTAFAKKPLNSEEFFKLEGIITSRDLKARKGTE